MATWAVPERPTQLFITTNIYTLMEIKLIDKTTQHIRMYNTALITQRNNHELSRRFTEKLRLLLSESWEEGPSTDMKVQWRSPPDGCRRHNSHDDTTNDTVTTWLADHRPSNQFKESPRTTSRIAERLSREIRRRTSRQYNSFVNE